MFANMDNDYFRERASDVLDVKKRFLAIICEVKLPDLLLIDKECVIVAHDLTPSETAVLNKKYVKGFATDIGGATSHSAIMAKTLEIPAVVGLKNITELVKDGDKIGIDAKGGLVEILQGDEEVKEWEQKLEEEEKEKAEIEMFKNANSLTRCGTQILVKGNIGHPKDVKKVVENGGRGVGLFRSEFLYMESQNWPSEEEQFNAYREAVEGLDGEELVVRTLDIGGDKHLNYFKFPEEMNPFLGYRAIRLSLDKREIFETQLRAIIRTSKYGKIKIMFPMITTLGEFREAYKFTKEVEEKLVKEGFEVGVYKVGMMVEVPASAVLTEKFARESEFFSIGSNDLIQYTHAVDRMSKEINYLYQPNNPSILNLIKMTTTGGKLHGREVSVCGEMASNPISAILLIGLGVYTLSMNATTIPNIKRVISQVSIEECEDLANKALEMSTEEEVVELVTEFIKKNGIKY